MSLAVSVFSEEQRKIHHQYGWESGKIPAHVAIIMDGNGRWAKKRFLPRKAGHKQGAEALRNTIKACREFGVRFLSVYVFSTENWKRPPKEVEFLMAFFKELIIKELPELNKNGVRVRCLGDVDALDPELKEKIAYAENATETNTTLQLNLLINYGSRREIVQAAAKAWDALQRGEITELTEENFSDFLYTGECPEPEIFIRTGGDYRISNYLLWQISYSELFFLDLLWPDFNKNVLAEIIGKFQQRQRRFGGLEQE